MTENAPAPEDAAAARAAEQARLRKERREAKIRAGGTARLNKITGLGGGIQRDTQPATAEQSSSPSAEPPAAPAPHHADPDEVDISEHYYAPQTTARLPPDPANMMPPPSLDSLLGYGQPGLGGGGPDQMQNPFMDPSIQDDPMLKLLSQMMGAGPGGDGAGGGPPQNPFFPGGGGVPGMPNPFGGPQGQQQQQQPAVPDTYAAVWRILHFVLALGLGLYIAALTSFSGTKIERERAAFDSRSSSSGTSSVADQEAAARRYFFWAYATAEAALLSSRMLLDRGRAGGSGLLWTLVGMLPEPARGLVSVAARYGQVFSTVRSDLLVCVFVLGCCSWLRSA
ncbi:Golgi to ER traffic protein 2 [Pleurostoma richardsiae]|uniref:Golgi to ER traffic protein 2 n=1 Tax=Pleurostoma richardsiae TaxID=41990 RepID=A0AA38RIH1_9PEZI|nr:Golgi to ER traffic protein 2 [Pleurostoma richardsiae]